MDILLKLYRISTLSVLGLALMKVAVGEISLPTITANTSATVTSLKPPSTSGGVSTYKTTATTKTTTASTLTTTGNKYAYCAAYCDIFGNYRRRRHCPRPTFCCGDYKTRYCCDKSAEKITADYDDVKTCPNTAWWLFHWRVIVGLLGSIMVIMMIGACVYYCCIGLCRNNQTVRNVQRRFQTTSSRNDEQGMSTVSGSRGGPGDGRRSSFSFDPNNPNAFQPPAYDSLPADPPKYSDIFSDQGQDNAAFCNDGSRPSAGPDVGTLATVATQSGAAAASPSATETAVTMGSSTSSTVRVEAANTEASPSTAPSGAVVVEITAPATQPAAQPGSTPHTPNRTTEVTPSRTPAPMTIATVQTDAPPPYVEELPTATRATPGEEARSCPVNLPALSRPAEEDIRRITVGNANQPESQRPTITPSQQV